MANFVNAYALETKQISSAALGPLGMVLHRMAKPGRFLGRVIASKIEIGRFELDVMEGGPQQIDIDLAQLVARPGAGSIPSRRYKVDVNGFALFFVSKGSGGYRVTLETTKSEKSKAKSRKVFDSNRLRTNDMFVVTLIRPGTWTARDIPSKGEARIQVTYPEPGKSAYRPKDEANLIKVGKEGLRPKRLKIGPAEGVAFLVRGKSASIAVELTKPNDGPPPKKDKKPKGRSRVRWTNPRPPGC